MNKKLIIIFAAGLLLVAIGYFALGFYVSNTFYKSIKLNRGEVILGVWTPIPIGKDKGNWIAIRVKSDDIRLSPSQMINTSYHEIGHELYDRYVDSVSTRVWNKEESEKYAVICQYNITKCLEVLK